MVSTMAAILKSVKLRCRYGTDGFYDFLMLLNDFFKGLRVRAHNITHLVKRQKTWPKHEQEKY